MCMPALCHFIKLYSKVLFEGNKKKQKFQGIEMVSLRLIGAIVAFPTMIGIWVVTFDRYWRVSGNSHIQVTYYRRIRNFHRILVQ